MCVSLMACLQGEDSFIHEMEGAAHAHGYTKEGFAWLGVEWRGAGPLCLELEHNGVLKLFQRRRFNAVLTPI